MNCKKILMASAIIVSTIITGCKKEKYITDSGNLVLKTVDEDPLLPSIYVNGTQLQAETFGNKDSAMTVSYTHLDVYKRQGYRGLFASG